MERGDGTERKTLARIPYYPTPQELTKQIQESKGWPYKRNPDRYVLRDKSLPSLTYLAGLRISEVLRLRKKQFSQQTDRIKVQAILLSKSRAKRMQRQVMYRDADLPLDGERAELTFLVQKYLETLQDEDRLYPFGAARAWQIVTAYLPESTNHWLRAYCETYLYDKWDHDLLAVSDYVKVDARTLQLYIRKRHEKYGVV